MSLPKLSKRANTRVEWCLEAEDGSFEDYVVDAYVTPGSNPYYTGSLDKDVPGYGADIDYIDIYKVEGDEYKPVHITTLFSALSDKQASSLDYLLEQEYNDNMEMLDSDHEEWEDEWEDKEDDSYEAEEPYYDPFDREEVDDIVRHYKDDY